MLGTIGLFVLFVLWHVVVVRSGNLQFWHLASANPDVAYDWFLSDDTWTIVDRPEDLEKLGAEKDDLVGPFTLLVPKLGREVTIYADPSRIETSQRAFMAMIGPYQRTGMWASTAALIYPLLASMAVPREAGNIEAFGYGLANLGYVLGFSGVVVGHFRALGFYSRKTTILAAVAVWTVGLVLVNVRL